MTFKDRFDSYRDGRLNEDEAKLIKEEIEKVRIISEYLGEEWEDDFSLTEENDTELKSVKKRLKKNNILIVLTSIILCAVIYFAGTFFVIPAVESSYPSPEDNTYNIEFTDDLELAIVAYSEMFTPNRYIGNVSSEKTGFAKYDIKIQYGNASTGDIQYFYGTMDKGDLTINSEFWDLAPMNVFENACRPQYPLDEANKERFYNELSALPDYITVTAAVSFSEDMDMDEIIALQNEIYPKEGNITWIGIRNCDPSEQRLPHFGIAPFIGGYVRDAVNEYYPYFDVKWVKDGEMTADILKTHTDSILSLCIDLHENGLPETFVSGLSSENYLSEIRGYLDENGMYSYGCYITAPASVFIDLLDTGVASQVWPEDAYIDF